MKKIVLILAFIGYALSFHSLYAFHIFALLWVLSEVYVVFFLKQSIPRIQKDLRLIGLILIYIIFSIFWVENKLVGLRYLFYLSCGVITFNVTVALIRGKQDLVAISKLLGILISINILFGLLEALGVFRLPVSPYSPYATYFGYQSTDLSKLPVSILNSIIRKPTGFNWNPNNFGFFLIIVFPFILFSGNKLYSFFLSVIVVFLLVQIGSRACFIAALTMMFLFPFYNQSRKKRIILVLVFFTICIILLFLPLSQLIGHINLGRMQSAFAQLAHGLELMMSDDILATGSTSYRARLYKIGLEELFRTMGFGLGFGGAESALIRHASALTSFHFFFLQLLVDIGIFPFSVFMIWYFRLVNRLRIQACLPHNASIAKYMKASSLSLLIAIPGSLAPSGIHYFLPFYILIGFSVSLLRLSKQGSVNEGHIA